MRHAVGFVLGLLLAPVILAAAGWGYFRAVSGVALADPQSNEVLSGLGLAAAAGLVIGLLAAARWLSPVAALIVSLGYLGLTAFYVLALDEFTDLMPDSEVGNGAQGLVASGVVALVGTALLISAIMPHRWARAREQTGQADPLYADLPPYDTSGYGPPAGYGMGQDPATGPGIGLGRHRNGDPAP
jgi:hypothetical protein